ncbi:MAG TPA: CHAT domain-containing protein [Gemmatimonadaceae bacterium]|nr:CHAT domain-containing protein [Gemmatimonadaceae bacterium]
MSAVAATARFTGRSPLRRLAVAVGEHRVTRARLTGDFAYVPCDSSPNDSLVAGLVCDRTSPSVWAEAGRLADLAAELRKQGADSGRAGEANRAVATWQIIWGDPARGVEMLTAAAAKSPADATIQSDLATAFLARAEREQDPRFVLDAVTAADSALVLDSLLATARFNRAVALENLGLRSDADTAWSAYLAVDGRSAWADEARLHRARLAAHALPWTVARDSLRAAVANTRDSVVRAITAQYPARVRTEVRRTMAGWARAYVADSTARADSLLASAAALAQALAAVTGDSLWSHAIAPLAASTVDRRNPRTVAQGLLDYERGDVLLLRSLPDSAEPLLLAAGRAFREANNAAQWMAAFNLAATNYTRQTPRAYELAAASLLDLRATVPNAYRIVRGQVARTQGVLFGIQANFGAAISAYTTAITESRGTGDPGLELRPHANLAANYAGLGDDRSAWIHMYDALRQSSRYADLGTEMQRLLTRSADLSAQRAPGLSLLFQRQATRLARQSNLSAADSLLTLAALIREAELLGRRGRVTDALETVREARSYADRIASDSIRAASNADIDLVEGQVWVASRPDSAIRVLSSVASRFRETKYYRQLTRAELLLANAYVAAGAADDAQRHFEAALSEVERRRANIAAPEDRARFLDQARPVIDTLVKLRAERGDTIGALGFLEQMRGRVLLERVRQEASATDAAPDSLDTIRRSLPASTAIVSYAVLPRELLAWVITRDGVTMRRTRTDADVGGLTTRYASLMTARSADAETKSTSRALHRLLIAPVEGDLPKGGRLVIVPDKSLQFVPFAALYDSATSTFLVERHEITVAPSVRLYAESSRRFAALRQSAAPSVLAVGDPAFDPRVFTLARLPNAGREAKRVSELYARSELLSNAAATKPAMLREAARSNVIHFAGHGVVRPDAPLLSYLVLAADSGASSALTAKELFDTRLPATWLAVLSGCQTAGGRVSDTEGVSSLARAFFAAGVPAVVASLWSVDDEATADFFSDYHLELSKGADPSAALRHTQVEWVKKTSWGGASTWAAFTLFGATKADTPAERGDSTGAHEAARR